MIFCIQLMRPTLNSTDLAPYKNLHGAKVVQHPDVGPCFICEGRYLVEDAIQATGQGQLRLISLLCDSKQAEEWKARIPRQTQLLTLDSNELDSLVGFKFHRGVLCCCAVPEGPSEAQVLQSARLLVLPHLDDVDNLGQLSRTAAALGIDAILIGKGPSPFEKRCVRVSMGAVWKIPILKCDNPERILDEWLQHSPNIETEIVGTAQTPSAESAWEWAPAPRTALVLGQESCGLNAFWQSKCIKHVRIPLARQIDSLNVSVAGVILMSNFVSRAIQL